jgi:hypothetical protein
MTNEEMIAELTRWTFDAPPHPLMVRAAERIRELSTPTARTEVAAAVAAEREACAKIAREHGKIRDGKLCLQIEQAIRARSAAPARGPGEDA